MTMTTRKPPQKPRVKTGPDPEYHFLTVEKIKDAPNDPIEDAQDRGYEVVGKSDRRQVLMRVPFKKHKAEMEKVHNTANDRLREMNRPDIGGPDIVAVTATNKVTEGLSAKELAAGVQEATDMDG